MTRRGARWTYGGVRAAIAWAALGVLVALTVAGGGEARADEPRVIVVLDGSGSIWGKIDGGPRSKLVLIREELVKGLRQSLPNALIGLTTFGAQAGGSCEAASALLAPARGQLDKLEELLDQFNPQGRGPIALGLKTAADQVQDGKPTRLLLIHDGPDNCGQDVCALARELAATKRHIAVDVLSLALAGEDKGSMRCLASATGGALIEAGDTEAAVAGLNRIIAALAEPTARGAPARDQLPAAAKPGPTATPATGLDLSARLASTQTPVTRGLGWRIESIAGIEPPIARDVLEAAPQIDVPPARYRVTLRTAVAEIDKEVVVAPGTRQPVVFEFAGGLVEIAADDAQTEGMPAGAMLTIVRDLGAGRGGEPILAGPATAARAFLLPAGSYLIKHSDGLGQRSARVDVAPGAVQQATFGGPLGRLIVTAEKLRPEQIGDAIIKIAVDDPSGADGRREIAASAAPSADFRLPPGPYHITLSVFGSETRVVSVLGAGQTSRVALELQQMALRVSSHIGPGSQPPMADARYRVWRADQLDKPIATSKIAQPVFHLAPGKYRIESRIGLQNAVIHREFDVGNADFGRLALSHKAGRVLLALPDDDARAAQTRTYWEVIDGQGQLVWRGFERAPSLLLAAGAYEARAQARARRYVAKFIVTDGRTETVGLISD